MKSKFSFKQDTWIKPYFKKYKYSVILAIFLGLIMFFCASALMFTAGYTIDKSATMPSNIMAIYVPIVLMRAFGIGRPLFRYLERLVSHNWVLKVTSDLRKRLYDVVESNTSTVGGEYQTGTLLSLLTEDIGHLQNLYLRTIFPAILGDLLGVIITITLAGFSLPLAGAFLILILFELVIVPLISLNVEGIHKAKQKADKAKLYTELTDQILGENDWQISGRFIDFKNRTKLVQKDYILSQRKSAYFDWARDFSLEIIFGLVAVCLLYFTNKTLTYSQNSANFIGAIILAWFPLTDGIVPVSQGIEDWNIYGDSVKRLNQMHHKKITLPHQVDSDPRDFEVLAINHLSFTYPNEQIPIIKDFSLTLKLGQKAALIGPSGAGKTTILQLILGDLSANSGSVKLNGIDIQKLQSQRSKLFSVLNQNPFLFNTTIFENLKMANPKATQQDILKVLNEVQLGEFISSLPNKLNTPVQEAGARFSGGQRQRLALARVLLQDAPIVLLDEPTAGLDPLTEKNLLELVFTVLKNKTVIWITHNLQAMNHIDQVIFLKDGSIEMQGSPKALYQNNKHFHELYLMDRGLVK